MDVAWTDPTTIPKKLYRVICPNQNTHYDPKNGLVVPLNTPAACFIDDLPLFHHSIRCHRDQKQFPSPYISLFESLPEAEMYCIAAADFHTDIGGDKCFIIEIDTTGREFRRNVRPWLWFVHDIQVMCPRGVQLGEGPKDGLVKGVNGGRFDSEWLCLFAVPGGKAMRVLKGSRECRFDQEWEGENELAVTGPMRLRGGISTAEIWLSMEPIIVVWEQCKICVGANGCEHGGFDALRAGTLLSQMIREDVPDRLSEVLSRPAKDAKDMSASKRRKVVADQGGESMKYGGGVYVKSGIPTGKLTRSEGSAKNSTPEGAPRRTFTKTTLKGNAKK